MKKTKVKKYRISTKPKLTDGIAPLSGGIVHLVGAPGKRGDDNIGPLANAKRRRKRKRSSRSTDRRDRNADLTAEDVESFVRKVYKDCGAPKDSL